jgi:membrane-bound lytic murein transglycosylase B
LIKIFFISAACLTFTITQVIYTSEILAKEPRKVADNPVTFDIWLAGVKKEALENKISEEVLNIAFKDITLNPKVIKLDRRQPEFTITLKKYIDGRVTKARIKRGKDKLTKHSGLFTRAEDITKVQRRYIASIWGMETNYGGYTGGYSVVRSLMTLAYDMRRSKFFRAQLMKSLQILEEGHIPMAEMKGSWAGAMGQGQFMPESFFAYAYDLDGDGKKNIWTDYGDSFASIGNYLKKHGWRNDQTWGREVTIPKNLEALLEKTKRLSKPKSCARSLKHHSREFTLAQWQEMGVRTKWGSDLPKGAGFKATLLMPAGKDGPAYLTYENFRTILTYNCSNYYALGVSLLSDKLK